MAGDVAAGLRFPLPDPLDEGVAAQVVARLALGLESPFHHHLGSDTGVVSARLPQGVVPLHAAIAHQGIHDRVVEAVPHVQAAGDVRRRNHDAVGGAAIGCIARCEIAALLPGLVPALFQAVRVVGFFHQFTAILR